MHLESLISGSSSVTELRPIPPRVLVADDQGDIRDALALLLSSAGLTVEVVNSPSEILSRLATTTFDLILMDLNYSRGHHSGREGLGILHDIVRRDASVPVLVMTGWGTIDIAVEAMRCGAKDVVQKPWDDEALLDMAMREIAFGQTCRQRDAFVAREREEAGRTQSALLPVTMPQLGRCQLAARWVPAAGVGGDCYDVLPFSDNLVAVCIADAIGRGVPAALLVSSLHAAVRAFATAIARPEDVCSNANRLLVRSMAEGKFITCCYSLIDTATGTMHFCNAGHCPPIVVRRSGTVERLEPTGLVLGVNVDERYTSGQTQLHAGDRLVWFTDGVTEARSHPGEYFSDDRLIGLIRDRRGDTADSIADAIAQAIRAWTHGALDDDFTVVVAAITEDTPSLSVPGL